MAPERRRIGYVPQEGSLFPHLTVAANVGFGLPRRQRRGPLIAELLECGRAERPRARATRISSPAASSSGSRWPGRWPSGPRIVLLDEPFASLDAHLRASIRADVQQLLRRPGTTAVLVTHDQDEALSIADLVAVLRDGRIAQCGAPLDLYARPADAEIARFIGRAPTSSTACVGADMVDTVLGRLPVELAGPGNPGARPGHRPDPA